MQQIVIENSMKIGWNMRRDDFIEANIGEKKVLCLFLEIPTSYKTEVSFYAFLYDVLYASLYNAHPLLRDLHHAA